MEPCLCRTMGAPASDPHSPTREMRAHLPRLVRIADLAAVFTTVRIRTSGQLSNSARIRASTTRVRIDLSGIDPVGGFRDNGVFPFPTTLRYLWPESVTHESARQISRSTSDAHGCPRPLQGDLSRGSRTADLYPRRARRRRLMVRHRNSSWHGTSRCARALPFIRRTTHCWFAHTDQAKSVRGIALVFVSARVVSRVVELIAADSIDIGLGARTDCAAGQRARMLSAASRGVPHRPSLS